MDKPRVQSAFIANIVFVGEVEDSFHMRAQLQQAGSPTGNQFTDTPAKCGLSGKPLQFGFSCKYICKPVRLRQVYPAVCKGSASELSGFGFAQPFDCFESPLDSVQDRPASMAVKFHQILTCRCIWAGKPQNQGLIELIFG